MRSMALWGLVSCASYDADVAFTFCNLEAPAEPGWPADHPEPTWHQDVAPIVAARCQGCHEPGGIAALPLTSRDEVVRFRDAVHDAVASERMPPWPPESCCGQTYRDSRRLPDAERATLLRWLEGDQAEGDPKAPAPPIERPSPGPSRIDAVVTMPEAYTPVGKVGDSDDIRCFVIDLPPEARGRYVTGLRFDPGTRALVHHVVISTVTGRNLADAERRQAEEPGAGFDCYEGTFLGASGILGGWVPGAEGADYPEGWVTPLPDDGKILLNVHYDVSAAPDGLSDQSSIAFKLEDEPPFIAETTTFAVLNPLWLFDNGMRIEPGAVDAAFAVHWDPQPIYGRERSWDLHKVFLHMHEYGVSGRVAVMHADGTQTCLLDVAEWDFAWHGDYWFETPVRFHPGDRLFVECRFRNPTDRALRWGADEEMCAALVSAVEVL
ncbi:MAG: hypothetical protein AAGA48_31090 [Myxococcota bacterium]